MKCYFTDEEIKKAIEQADANIAFEEIDMLVFEPGLTKTLGIDKK